MAEEQIFELEEDEQPSPAADAGSDDADSGDGDGKTGGAEPADKAAAPDYAEIIKENNAKIQALTDLVTRLEYTRQQPAAKPAAAEPDVEDDSPEAFTDALTREGIKALAKRGVLTKKEIPQLIDSIAEKVAERVRRENGAQQAENSLIAEYPELKNKESALFRKTQQILADVGGDATPASVRLAAKLAKSDIDAAEKERTARVSKQSGARGRAVESSLEDEGIDSDQAQVMRAMGVKPEEFKKQQKIIGIRRAG